MGASVIASAQNITCADTNFRNALVNTLCVDIDGDDAPDVDVDANDDGIIQLSEALAVQRLNVLGAGIQSMSGIENFTNLIKLECGYNVIESLDVHLLSNLQYLDCAENYIDSINVLGLTYLKTIICNTNQLSTINVQGLTALQSLNCNYNPITALNVQNLDNLKYLNCVGMHLNSLDVQGLDSLFELRCDFNYLTGLNVQGLNKLAILSCGHNFITSFNPHLAINLWQLFCDYNPLTTLNVQGLTNLQYLTCDSTQLTSINVQGLVRLSDFNCSHNSITSLNLSGLHQLMDVQCTNNLLADIDFSQTYQLSQVICNNNQLTSLDFSDCVNLYHLICDTNNLTMLNLKNTSDQFVSLSNNPSLAYLCCDDSEIENMQMYLESSGSSSCIIGNYCSFNPGGIFYTISGANRLDLDNNGCNSSDSYLSNLKYRVSSATASGYVISDTSGNYSLPLQAGNYVIKPIFENPAYYTADSLVISLPAANNPFIHNFCITPNGVHHDLEISIIPLIPARPGFDATYKIVYKNKGNQPESGSFSFSYTDSLVDFISANQTPNAQTAGLLTWNFSNLIPMQSREIIVTMNCNAPTETPALNVDDILKFNAVIIGGQTDETIVDNGFGLNQTVVGSYDPNDKTCLEGNRITPSMVGNYIHYLIRFENTGTWAAENIVVKDILDTTVFDASTLLVTDASHNAYTRMTNGNQVEFIFENIQLPFDDAHNDGYIAFKIKTKADLVVGDSIKNIANIYFDYNLPIVTNEAQTTVQNPIVGIEESLSSSINIELFPNPVVDVLTFKTDLKIDKIEIYDLFGRLVQTLDVDNNQVKIAELPIGSYLVKLHTSGKSYFSKVVKR